MRSCENNSIAYDKTRRYRTLPDLVAGGFIIFRVVYWKRTA